MGLRLRVPALSGGPGRALGTGTGGGGRSSPSLGSCSVRPEEGAGGQAALSDAAEWGLGKGLCMPRAGGARCVRLLAR